MSARDAPQLGTSILRSFRERPTAGLKEANRSTPRQAGAERAQLCDSPHLSPTESRGGPPPAPACLGLFLCTILPPTIDERFGIKGKGPRTGRHCPWLPAPCLCYRRSEEH